MFEVSGKVLAKGVTVDLVRRTVRRECDLRPEDLVPLDHLVATHEGKTKAPHGDAGRQEVCGRRTDVDADSCQPDLVYRMFCGFAVQGGMVQVRQLDTSRHRRLVDGALAPPPTWDAMLMMRRPHATALHFRPARQDRGQPRLFRRLAYELRTICAM